jgi:hypothetical protein
MNKHPETGLAPPVQTVIRWDRDARQARFARIIRAPGAVQATQQRGREQPEEEKKVLSHAFHKAAGMTCIPALLVISNSPKD